MGTSSSGGLLLGFLNGYPNPIFSRFGSGSGSGSGQTSESRSSAGGQSGNATSLVAKIHTSVGAGLTSRCEKEDEGTRTGQITTTSRTGLGGKRFTLWAVIIIGLISFLIGSLLRSLISPADFIYVVRDLGEAGEMRGGWREVKRLVEVKYIVGGWDFQIAVVRRH